MLSNVVTHFDRDLDLFVVYYTVTGVADPSQTHDSCVLLVQQPIERMYGCYKLRKEQIHDLCGSPWSSSMRHATDPVCMHIRHRDS